MATTAPLDDEKYNSASDEDFDPSLPAPSEDGDDSDSDARQPDAIKAAKRKASVITSKEDVEEALDADFANSGDEGIIKKGRKRRRRGKDDDDLEDEDGGEGGLVKTRAQRAKEGRERKPLAHTGGATVDVDAVWKSMLNETKSEPIKRNSTEASKVNMTISDEATSGNQIPDKHRSMKSPETRSKDETANVISITQTTTFAGETTTTTKTVARDSQEAKVYLQLQDQPSQSASNINKPALRRPKKRSSLFDAASTIKTTQPVKLNTIEKSKLDWAGFVDKEGIAEELEGHSKAKEGYMGRMDFLSRVEGAKEDERRRQKGI